MTGRGLALESSPSSVLVGMFPGAARKQNGEAENSSLQLGWIPGYVSVSLPASRGTKAELAVPEQCLKL